MSRLAELQLRRAALGCQIARTRSDSANAAVDMRADIGAALLGASIARLLTRNAGMRGFLGVAAGVAAALAMRSFTRRGEDQASRRPA
jgi:hypothetical protein